jgi:branched-chain amino acid transport system substrate-binding protein
MMLLAVLVAVPLVTACGFGQEAAETAVAADTEIPCSGTVAVMAPYGGVGGKDSVQMNWVRMALETYNEEHGTDFTLLPADVDTDTVRATRAAKLIAIDPEVVGVVGPQTSGVAEAVGPIFVRAGLAFVSASATRTTLTDGRLPGFFRVVPNDSIQGPRIAEFVADDLGAAKVLVVDQQEAYSLPLAETIATGLRERGVTVDRAGTRKGQTDYTAVIDRIDDSTDAVVLSFLEASEAQDFADEMRARGKEAEIVGGDSLFVLGDFYERGAYVTSYAPDTAATEEGRRLLRVYQTIFGAFEPYGAPAFVAMEAVLSAADASCVDGIATRQGVASTLPKIELEDSIFGYPVGFDPNGDVIDGRYNVYRIDGNRYTLVD